MFLFENICIQFYQSSNDQFLSRKNVDETTSFSLFWKLRLFTLSQSEYTENNTNILKFTSMKATTYAPNSCSSILLRNQYSHSIGPIFERPVFGEGKMSMKPQHKYLEVHFSGNNNRHPQTAAVVTELGKYCILRMRCQDNPSQTNKDSNTWNSFALLSLQNKRFHGFCYHLESGNDKTAVRMKSMTNTAKELLTVSNVSIHL